MCYFYTQLLTSEVKLNAAAEWFTCTICLPACLSVVSLCTAEVSTAEDCVQGMENELNRKLSSLSRIPAFQTESFQQLFWLFSWVDVTYLFFGPN
jgi:hypothetical protein